MHQRVVTDRSSPPNAFAISHKYLNTKYVTQTHTPSLTHTHTIYISIHQSIYPHEGHSASPTTTTPLRRASADTYSPQRDTLHVIPTHHLHLHPSTRRGTLASPPPPPPCGAPPPTPIRRNAILYMLYRLTHYLPLTTDLPRRSTSHLTTPPSTYHFRPPDSVTRHTTIYYCISVLVWTTPASTSNTFTIHSQHTSS